MKVKNFQDYLEKRLDKVTIAEINKQAKLEHQALKNLQSDLAKALADYMKKEDIGFNEMVRRLGVSPTQVHKIQNGTANVTLATLAHFAALMKKQPHLVFKE